MGSTQKKTSTYYLGKVFLVIVGRPRAEWLTFPKPVISMGP